MTRRYDLLIFDWDGTVVDSVGPIVANFQTAIRDLDLPARSDAQIASLIGLGIWEAMDILFPDLGRPRLQALFTDYRDRHPNRRMDHGRPFDGVPAMLDALRGQGYRLAVATGKGRTGLDQSLESAGMADWFEATRTADECASKPAPDMIEELLWETGVAPEAALMVGDTEFDLAMARNARVDAVGVLCGAHDEARLVRCAPRTVLQRTADLGDWLAQ